MVSVCWYLATTHVENELSLMISDFTTSSDVPIITSVYSPFRPLHLWEHSQRLMWRDWLLANVQRPKRHKNNRNICLRNAAGRRIHAVLWEEGETTAPCILKQSLFHVFSYTQRETHTSLCFKQIASRVNNQQHSLLVCIFNVCSQRSGVELQRDWETPPYSTAPTAAQESADLEACSS